MNIVEQFIVAFIFYIGDSYFYYDSLSISYVRYFCFFVRKSFRGLCYFFSSSVFYELTVNVDSFMWSRVFIDVH